MSKMSFDEAWIQLIMRCISTVSYSVVLNGISREVFSPKRGLRQGNPLSPFLFLICSEGLFTFLKIAREKGTLRGVKASKRSPQITHLRFADDCILFGEATDRGVGIFEKILKEYEVCSGQCVNYGKSTIFFSSNTTDSARLVISNRLGVKWTNNSEKYLGLPNMLGKKRMLAFQHLKDRIKMKIDGWSTRLLSQRGKEVFIKAVLQAIPVYTMGYFLLPKSVCVEMEQIIAKFWWQKGYEKRGYTGVHGMFYVT
ncbi:hypothetical protein J1N35_006087 [Gossypium stocksii]|uniref:Reverse transcriptase domain-containing protein n=1 Tax=Gossypium stocksii TaxID=47602 RepID=A0A9D4AHR1_9ROSI|nr:hypothetical protein J1N35_006087 [Gossypium stocksii]